MAYHDRSDGGVWATLCEMTFAGRCGAIIDIEGDLLSSLFNEELGAVIQVSKTDEASVIDAFNKQGLADCVSVIGTAYTFQRIIVTQNGETVFEESRAKLQQAWSETSYKLQALRDNPSCAQQEFERITNNADKGLFSELSFDPRENIVAELTATKARPKVAILRGST